VFAFWGAEEIGLLGSREWVRSMRRDHPNEWRKIVANINLDMLGSPNYISLVKYSHVLTGQKRDNNIFMALSLLFI
jgi:Zn-dependent M28 family amino/carboxypeptidase